eukprot:393664_1
MSSIQKKSLDITDPLISQSVQKQKYKYCVVHKPFKDNITPNQLNMIYEPLYYKTYTCSCLKCCMCLSCVDLVHDLTNEEREIKLICGYIRQNSRNLKFKKPVPLEIYRISANYTGKIDIKKLKSKTEIQREQRKIKSEMKKIRGRECKQRCHNVCQLFCECLALLTIVTVRLISILLPLIFLAKDIAAITINIMNDCNNAMDRNTHDTNVPFDIETWIWVGSISHLIPWFCTYCCFLQGLYFMSLDGECLCIFCTGFVCSWAFFVAWLVIGFLMNDQMSNDTKEEMECGLTVFWWCMIQAVECVIVPCLIYCMETCNSNMHDIYDHFFWKP